MAEAIERISCSNAEELIRCLGRENSLWGGVRQFWVFRGHSIDEEYKLKPSALRDKPKAMLGYSFSSKQGIRSTNQEQKDAEFERLHEFYWAIDAQGLNVPGDSNLLRTPNGWKILEDKINSDGWPIDDLLPLLALAQHYEVPTRLLDWAEKPLAATYFAAKGALRDDAKGLLSVWALNFDWIINTAFPSNTKMAIYVVTAPRAWNPNLHAQGGIFTTEILVRSDFPHPVSTDPVDVIVENKWKALKWAVPVMAHITLPRSEAKKLLRLLNQEGVSAATIYPGYKGVADSLKERDQWDVPERATYWMKP